MKSEFHKTPVALLDRVAALVKEGAKYVIDEIDGGWVLTYWF